MWYVKHVPFLIRCCCLWKSRGKGSVRSTQHMTVNWTNWRLWWGVCHASASWLSLISCCLDSEWGVHFMQGLPLWSCRNWEAACLITNPTTSWCSTETGMEQRTKVLGVLWCGGWVRECLTPWLWKTRTMRFCLDWRLSSFASVAIVPRLFC